MRRSDEELINEALHYVSKAAFRKGSSDHAKAAWRKGLVFWNKICSHMDTLWEPKWVTIEEVQKEALKYTNRTSFARGSSGAYDKAQRMGLLDTVCSFMGEKPNEAYSLEEIRLEAQKYNSKSEFREKSSAIWEAAYRRKEYEYICSHMDTLWEVKWDTFEKINLEALKYKTPSEFKKKSSGAFDAALNRKVLDLVCFHMEKKYGVSLKELELTAEIKAIYSKAKKFRDRKVNIPNKPHIEGFEIDVFVPELNKGVEFDGTYWHSFEKMKTSKNKKNWPDDDIHNYHKLKDDWFASKGIQILHIKEEDWDLDKEVCIEKCLEFLRGENVKQVA